MTTITQGYEATFDIRLVDPDSTPFDLTGSTSTVTLTNVAGTALLTLSLVIDNTGVTTTSSGLAVASGGVSAGVVTMTITALQTAALPLGRVFWEYNLTDQDGNTPPPPASGEFMVIAANARRDIEQNYGTSLAELRRQVADRFGDLLEVEATEATDSSHIKDTFAISATSDTLSGRELVVVSGGNVGHLARVSDTTHSTNTINIEPAAPGDFAVGDQIDVFNARSRGWRVREYNRAINAAIDAAFPLALVEFSADLDTEFNADAPSLDIPEAFYAIHDVSWLRDDTGEPVALRRHGWKVRDGKVWVSNYPTQYGHNHSIRIFGYGRFPRLQSDADTTTLSRNYIVPYAAYWLIISGSTREEGRGNLVMLFKDEMERARTVIRTQMKPGSIVVRQGI